MKIPHGWPEQMTESNPSAYSSTNSGRLATGDETENFLGGV